MNREIPNKEVLRPNFPLPPSLFLTKIELREYKQNKKRFKEWIVSKEFDNQFICFWVENDKDKFRLSISFFHMQHEEGVPQTAIRTYIGDQTCLEIEIPQFLRFQDIDNKK